MYTNDTSEQKNVLYDLMKTNGNQMIIKKTALMYKEKQLILVKSLKNTCKENYSWQHCRPG